jgi:DnaJ-class molecular chaperone
LCSGHGTYKGAVCPACSGAGKFLAPDKWIYCSLCSGNGIFKGEPCPSCGGRGKIRPGRL